MSNLEELTSHLAHKGYYLNRAGRRESMDDVSLMSHIVDNLYVGGCVQNIDVEDNFSHIFSMYPWERYRFGENTILSETTMYDREDAVDVDAVERISDAVVEALRGGEKVLVHCQAGINRSNLVAARALMKWKGLRSDEAIALLEEKRSPLILSNQVFKDYVLSTDFPDL